jgi:hypothetical protein
VRGAEGKLPRSFSSECHTVSNAVSVSLEALWRPSNCVTVHLSRKWGIWGDIMHTPLAAVYREETKTRTPARSNTDMAGKNRHLTRERERERERDTRESEEQTRPHTYTRTHTHTHTHRERDVYMYRERERRGRRRDRHTHTCTRTSQRERERERERERGREGERQYPPHDVFSFRGTGLIS